MDWQEATAANSADASPEETGADPAVTVPDLGVGSPPPPPVLHPRMGAAAAAQVVLALVAVLGVCYLAKLPIIVILVSVLLAFVLAPVVDLLDRVKVSRGLGAFVAVLLFLALLYGLGNLSYNRAVSFARDLPKYSVRIREIVGRVRQHAQDIQKSTQSVLPPSEEEKQRPTITIQQEAGWLQVLTANLGPVTEVLFMASFIPFLTFFMLSWQDHVRSSTVMLFRMSNRNTAYITLGLISGMIRTFIVGNLLVGFFIGLMSTVVFGILGLPYFYFIGFISGFLSLIPYLGVLLAVIPPVISGLGELHSSGFLVVILTVLGLHLFALNVLYPKFLGRRLQLNPLAVTVSLLFWGWMWGAMGLVLAVPLTAAAKIIFDHVEPLRGYGTWLGE